jgi:hypothetical protein
MVSSILAAFSARSRDSLLDLSIGRVQELGFMFVREPELAFGSRRHEAEDSASDTGGQNEGWH